MILRQLLIGLLIALALPGCRREAGNDAATLHKALAGFLTPPDSARTKVWWFHGETETTREGIAADLEAFRQAGVGGVVYYDQVHGTGENALDAFSPEWWEMLLYASRKADSLGLSFEVHISNGFVAGGPWITPELSMQMLAAADTVLCGAGCVAVKLPEPKPRYNYYRDVAVLAFPLPDDECDSRVLPPAVTTDIDGLDAEALFRENGKLVHIPLQKQGNPVYVNLDFGRDFTARSITYQAAPRGKATTSATNVPGEPSDTFTGTGYRVLPDLGRLEASDDGIVYRPVCRLLPIYKAHSSWKQKTISFPAVTARYFRLHLHDGQEGANPPDIQLGSVYLTSRAAVDQWEEKAGLFSEYIEADRTPDYRDDELICRGDIIDLTANTDTAGILRWDMPPGRWRVLRFYHTPTGGKTKHGRKNMMGPECDKLSARAAEVQWNHYFGIIADSIERHGGHLAGMAMDSHEAGSQNWTPGFEREFARLRGYDITPYLPVMAGYAVGSSEESNRFLHDVRRTIADLIAENYYGTLQRLCAKRGVLFTAQATGNALCIVADPIQAKGRVDKPQGEFWAIHPDGNYDIKESASAAHLYGKGIASAEAFTDAKFSHSPAYLKTLADYAYCFGINEFAVCASAYQPWFDKIPGSTGGGRHYCLNRNNTYWPYSRDFWDYQARCAYLMRQGRPVVDICVYLGENAPVKILTHRLPQLPSGFDFDACTTDALLTRMSAAEGRITLPDSMSYSMLVLPRNGKISWEALQKIATLIRAGVPVCGARPTGSEALCDLPVKELYDKLVTEIWGDETEPAGSRSYGKGRVYRDMPLPEAMALAGITPDIAMTAGDVKRDSLYFAHRRIADADLYFINNHSGKAIDDTFVFRSGKTAAEWWNPADGRRYRLTAAPAANGTVSLPLKLAAHESGFVVLTDAPDEALPAPLWTMREREETIDGEWSVQFDERLGGAGCVTFDTPTDWSTHADNRIKYYSGTAVYTKEIEVNSLAPGTQASLRFKALGDVARVVLNGDTVATVWCAPWEADITDALRTGTNRLEIFVTNSLMNRMIGDSELPENERVTYAFPSIVTPADPLQPSGLIEPPAIVYRY